MSSSAAEVDRLVREIQVLKNRDLVNICQANHLTKSGNKAELQKRIVNLMDSAVHDPNPRKFQTIKATILAVSSGSSSPGYRSNPIHYPPASTAIPSNMYATDVNGLAYDYDGSGSPNRLVSNNYGTNGSAPRARTDHQGLHFKSSPFYEVESAIGDIRTCDAMAQHRNSISILLRSTQYPELQRCANDPSLRVLIFCAASNIGIQDIAFPYQCEIKVNGGEVKANLRGLKNKPGSTRPVDITPLLRLKPTTYSNNLEFTYALTSKRYYLAIYLCKTYSATTLAERVERRNRITKESVIREAQDPDIVATSQVLSLKCPLTYMRLGVPIRAVTCKHIQCFDATSYLQLQEQGPQWICPVCSNPAPYASLAVDEYVKDILTNSSSETDQATIEPDGSWHIEKPKTPALSTPRKQHSQQHSQQQMPPSTSYIEDLDDVVSTPNNNNNNNASYTNGVNGVDTFNGSYQGGTPAPSSNQGTPAATSQSGRKRQRETEVIDLTLSDDDEPEPPVKRQHTTPQFVL